MQGCGEPLSEENALALQVFHTLYINVFLQWCYSSVSVALTVVLLWCYSGVQGCYRGVTVMLHLYPRTAGEPTYTEEKEGGVVENKKGKTTHT